MKKFLANFLLLPFSVSAANTNGLPALAPAYPEITPTFWDQHKIAVIIGGFIFIIAQSLLLWKMLMRLQPKIEPVENLSRAALASLLNEPEDGKLLSEVSRILRGYFGKQFQMAGEEATTAEFIDVLEQNQKLDAALKTNVAQFLRECDAAKFSPVGKVKELDAAERALDLVNEAEKLRATQNAASA